jgi:hypothetical protein
METSNCFISYFSVITVSFLLVSFLFFFSMCMDIYIYIYTHISIYLYLILVSDTNINVGEKSVIKFDKVSTLKGLII